MIYQHLETIINESIDEFYVQDSYLLEHDVHEQAISSALACHIRLKFARLSTSNQWRWNVDAEYNRNGETPKSLNGIGNVKPDIIIHRRGQNNPKGNEFNNLLIVEVKKNPSPEDKMKDLEKIGAFISDFPFHYCYGLFLGLNMEREKNDVTWLKRDGPAQS